MAPIGVLAFWEYYKAGTWTSGRNTDRRGLYNWRQFRTDIGREHLPEVIVRRAFGVLMVALGVRLIFAAK